MILVAQNAEREKNVTLEQCMAYAEEVDADPAKVVLDPGFRMSIGGGLIDNCGDGNISLPFIAMRKLFLTLGFACLLAED